LREPHAPACAGADLGLLAARDEHRAGARSRSDERALGRALLAVLDRADDGAGARAAADHCGVALVRVRGHDADPLGRDAVPAAVDVDLVEAQRQLAPALE